MRSRKQWLFAAALIGAVVMGWLMTASPIGQPKLMEFGDGTGMLDMRLFYTVPEANAMLTALDAEGICVYTVIESIDYGFIFCLAYVMSHIFRFLANRLGSPEKLHKLHWLSYGRGASDVVENSSILVAMYLYPAHNWVLTIAMTATMLKWLFLLLYFAAVVYMAIYWIYTHRKQS